MSFKITFGIIGVIFIIMGFVGIGYYAKEIIDKEQGNVKLVDCYDRYGNLILGQQCEKELSNPLPYFLIVFAGFMVIELGRSIEGSLYGF